MQNSQETNDNQLKKQYIIDEIMRDLMIYQNPDFLIEQYKKQIDIIKVNKSQLNKYYELFFNIRYAWWKILKYDLYFAEFYPCSDKIEKIEALNHHIHAYLQDMIVLKNKIETLVGELKNDVKKIAINRDEVISFFEAWVKETKEVFNGVSKYRDPHTHKGRIFFDGDLFKAKNAQGFLEIISSPIFDEMLNQEYKPKIIAKLTTEKEESFEKAKNRWIEIARNNNERVSNYLNQLLEMLRPSLYQFLNIKSFQEMFNLIDKKQYDNTN